MKGEDELMIRRCALSILFGSEFGFRLYCCYIIDALNAQHSVLGKECVGWTMYQNRLIESVISENEV